MNRAQLIERVDRVAATCVSTTADHGALTTALDDVARLESWTASRRAELVRLLAARPGAFPEADIADSTGCTLGAATKETDRAKTLHAATSFSDALDEGEIRPGHVDALTRTCKNLTDEQTETLLAGQDELAAMAATSSISAFDKWLKQRAAALRSEQDAEERLERQKRATRLRTWIDDTDGMWCMSGRFDPDTGRRLSRMLDSAVRDLFNETVPDTAPADRLERQQHLNALALVNLLDGTAPATGRPGPPIVVVDTTALTTTCISDDGTDATNAGAAGHDTETSTASTSTASTGTGHAHGSAEHAIPQPLSAWGVDWGIPVELPMSVLRDLFAIETPDVIVIADGVILHAPGRLDLGRTTRLANREQRRALRALYSTCAVPGCSVHYDRCKLHHVIWWRDGGRTDLDNLLPVCQHHHSRIHTDGWLIDLGDRRELTITLPDGRELTGRPRQERPRAA